MNIEIELAGTRLRLQITLPETAERFGRFLRRRGCETWDLKPDSPEDCGMPLSAPGEPLTPYTEFMLCMPPVSGALLAHERVLLHGVAFLWRGKAWLITAPSGTGKTTQYYHWKRLWPEETEIINGDKSVLAMCADGFHLLPSPWTGKEGDAGEGEGALGGIVVLSQAQENRIRRLSPGEAVIPLLKAFIVRCRTEAEALQMAALEEKLLRTTPVWLLENRGDEASAALTRETLLEYERKQDDTV